MRRGSTFRESVRALARCWRLKARLSYIEVLACNRVSHLGAKKIVSYLRSTFDWACISQFSDRYLSATLPMFGDVKDSSVAICVGYQRLTSIAMNPRLVQ